MFRNSTIVVVAIVTLTLSMSASAHHAVAAEYGNVSEPPSHTLIGEVTEVRWASPHVRIRILVLEGEKEGQTWDINGHAPGLMARTYGFLPGGVKVGDTVRVLGWISNFNVPRMVPRAISINDGPMHSVLRAADRRDIHDNTLGDIVPAPSVTAEQVK